MRKYTAAQIIGFILSFFLPPVSVWFTEGFAIDFWINAILSLIGLIPGSIHATYIWIIWIERKWKTHHGKEVTDHPFLIFSNQFEQRSRWKGNGQDGIFGTYSSQLEFKAAIKLIFLLAGYIDDNIKGGHGHNVVGGNVDPEQARVIEKKHEPEIPTAPVASTAPAHHAPAPAAHTGAPATTVPTAGAAHAATTTSTV